MSHTMTRGGGGRALRHSPSARAWLAGLARRARRRLRAWRHNAEMREELRELDDHLLADIGLTRFQAKHEIDRPFWEPVDFGHGERRRRHDR